jgi:choline kinase
MPCIRHAIVSCAGLGSRLGLNSAKCLVTVDGRPIIDYLLPLLANIEDVRLVVGFQEQEVMEHVSRMRSDIVFVRNSCFSSTSNSYSVNLGSHDIREPFIIVDGDMIIDPASFRLFLRATERGESLVGITPAKTDEAVFVTLDDDGYVQQFQRDSRTPFEWCGVAYLNGIQIARDAKFVFDELSKYLPLRSHELQCLEIDTPADLRMAQREVHKYDFSFA